ncbi:MAG: glycosyltransferase family 2 protein [Planctomycetota bacterium]|nr:glycosyltransferase family 2 protein [Planctomycetota bacterium]
MSTLPCLSIVILSWNTSALTLACLRALARDVPRRSRQIIVIDNASSDGSADAIESEFSNVELVRNSENKLYSAGNNQGAERATGEYVCLLNSDTEVVPGALDILVDYLEVHGDYGAVSPKLMSFDHSVQRACTRFPGLIDPLVDSTLFGKVWPGTYIHGRTRMHDFDHESSRDIDQPPGAVFMMRRHEYWEFGGLDPRLSLFYNDVDLCKRLWRKNRRIRYIADARVYHHQGASTSRSDRVQSLWLANREAFYRKHYGIVGTAWLRVVRWLWIAQVSAGVVLGPRKVKDKVKALRDLVDPKA